MGDSSHLGLDVFGSGVGASALNGARDEMGVRFDDAEGGLKRDREDSDDCEGEQRRGSMNRLVFSLSILSKLSWNI